MKNVENTTVKKAEEIINKAKQSNLPNEKVILEIIEEIFIIDKDNKRNYSFPNIDKKRNKAHYILLIKFIDFMAELFNNPENKRETLYITDINTINESKKLIDEVKSSIRKIDMESSELKKLGILCELYKIIAVIVNKGDKISINDLIDQAIMHIGFITKKHSIIKFITFCTIKSIFLKGKERKEIKFHDCQIDANNEVCINLLVDLLSNKISDECNVIISYIILRFKTFQTTIINYDLDVVQKAAENSIQKIKSLFSENDIIPVEKIFLVFIDEYENLLLIKKNTEQNEENIQLLDNNEINKSKIVEIVTKEEEHKSDNNPIQNPETKTLEDANKNTINEKNILDKRVNINDLNKILDKIKMDEKSKLELMNFFQGLNNRIDVLEGEVKESKESKQKIQGEVNELLENNNRLNGEVNRLNGEVNQLNNQNKEIKNILGKIQCREQGKTFLNSFYIYLDEKDKNDIEHNKTIKCDFYKEKAKIIKNALDEKFSSFKENKKYKLVTKLIDVVADSLTKGNANAHSLVIDLYLKDIDAYNKENNVFSIEIPQIFCFLKGINFDSDFHEAYLFLSKYFDKGLDAISWRDPDFMCKYLDN